MTEIPPPWVGVTGWRGSQLPTGWLLEHQLAETGGYFRVGRFWTRTAELGSGAALRLVGMPTRVLYRLMIDRLGRQNWDGGMDAAAEMGWTVDA